MDPADAQMEIALLSSVERQAAKTAAALREVASLLREIEDRAARPARAVKRLAAGAPSPAKRKTTPETTKKGKAI